MMILKGQNILQKKQIKYMTMYNSRPPVYEHNKLHLQGCPRELNGYPVHQEAEICIYIIFIVMWVIL
jgi:hypothetical protein